MVVDLSNDKTEIENLSGKYHINNILEIIEIKIDCTLLMLINIDNLLN